MKLQSAVQVEAPPDRDAWNALVAGAPEATVFHTSAWAELWTREWRGARWVAFVLEDEAGYAGGIPAIVRNRGIGRTVFSMPYGTYGGPLLRPGHPDPAAARLELLLAFARRAGSRWTLRSEMTWYQGSVPEIPASLQPSESFTHVLPLSEDFETVARGFHPSARRLVRQAEESGLTIRAASGEEDTACAVAANEGGPWSPGRRLSHRLRNALTRSAPVRSPPDWDSSTTISRGSRPNLSA